MLPTVLALGVLVTASGWWSIRVATDHDRFARRVAMLPAEPAVGWLIARSSPAVVRGVAAHCARRLAGSRAWHHVARTAAKRARGHPRRQLVVVATAVGATVASQAGRWRIAAWITATATAATTLHAALVH